MSCYRCRSAIDIIICLVRKIHQTWSQKQLAVILFLNIVETFDQMNSARLEKKMKECELNKNFRHWTQFFLANRKILLIIDKYQESESVIIELFQRFSVSSILFIIYINRIFKTIKRAVSKIRALFFADDIDLIRCKSSVNQISRQLQWAEEIAIKWSQVNEV